MSLQSQIYNKLNSKTTLDEFQEYFKQIFKIRGFQNDMVNDKMLMLMEEVGELAKALRKKEQRIAIDYDRFNEYESVESELADVFIVLLSICILEDINLVDAVLKKEEVNINRNWKI